MAERGCAKRAKRGLRAMPVAAGLSDPIIILRGDGRYFFLLRAKRFFVQFAADGVGPLTLRLISPLTSAGRTSPALLD